MPLRLAGEEFSVVQGLDAQGWPREIQANDGDPGIKITQSGSGPAIQVVSGDIDLGSSSLKTTNLVMKQGDVNTFYIRTAADDDYKSILARDLSITGRFFSQASPTSLEAGNGDSNFMILKARDNGVTLVEVARLQGAADPYLQATLPMVLKPSSEPGTVVEGHFWYDSTAKKLKFYNGTAVETVTSA